MKKFVINISLLTFLFSLQLNAGNTSSFFIDLNKQLLSAVQKESIEQIHDAINNGAKVNEKFGENQNTVLHFAADQNSPNIINFLLEKNSEIDSKNKFGASPLHIATSKEAINSVIALVEKNANINAKNEDGDTPLHIAVIKNNIKIVSILLESGSYINAANNKKRTPLHLAVGTEKTEIIKILMDYGANPYIKSNSDKNAFNYAKETTQSQKISGIIQNKIRDKEKKDKKEKQQSHNNLILTKKLEEKERHRRVRKKEIKKELDELRKKLSHLEIDTKSREDEINKLSNKLEKKLKIDEKIKRINELEKQNKQLEKNNRKAIQRINILKKRIAAIKIQKAFRSHIRKFIIKFNEILFWHIAQTGGKQFIEINNLGNILKFKDTNGNTALHVFASFGTNFDALNFVPFLLRQAIDINAKNNDGMTPLHLGVLHQNSKTVQLLINYDAQVNTQEKHLSYSPLHEAINLKNNVITKILINTKNINLNTQAKNGFTPLHIAAKKENEFIVTLLIQKGADPTITNLAGRRADTYSMRTRIINIIKGTSNPPEPINPNLVLNLDDSDGEF